MSNSEIYTFKQETRKLFSKYSPQKLYHLAGEVAGPYHSEIYLAFMILAGHIRVKQEGTARHE